MKIFSLMILSLGLSFGFAACNKKSGGKNQGAAATPVDPAPSQPVTPVATPTPAPGISTLTGTVCNSKFSSSTKTLTIDKVNNLMDITTTPGVTGSTTVVPTTDRYILSNPRTLFGKTEYTVSLQSGSTTQTGHMILGNSAILTGVPSSVSNTTTGGTLGGGVFGGTTASITGLFTCTQ